MRKLGPSARIRCAAGSCRARSSQLNTEQMLCGFTRCHHPRRPGTGLSGADRMRMKPSESHYGTHWPNFPAVTFAKQPPNALA
jgi:hypothetical protein